MNKTNLTHFCPQWGKKGIFGLLLFFFVQNLLPAQTCAPEAEFSYNATAFCQNGTDPIVSHTTGANGTYSYTTVFGGPTLALNPLTGNVDLSVSNVGQYQVTNTISTGGAGTLIVTGVVDGPLTGGIPKAIEFYVVANIPDLSIYGFSSANNGGGPTGAPEFIFPAVAKTAGSRFWVATDVASFNTYFGFDPDFVAANPAAINGDDAIEVFCNGTVIDVFGDVNVDGTGTPWDYLDGWAYRVNGTGPDGSTFVLANWTFSGINALDNTTTNATAPNPWPIATYSAGATFTCTRTIEIVTPPFAEAGDNQLVCESDIITLNASGAGQWSGGLGTFSNVDIANATYTPAPSEFGSTVALIWTVQSGVGGTCTSATDQVFIQILSGADAEFSYDKALYCPNGTNPILSHTTGTGGAYSYTVNTGGPILDLNANTGAINLANSDRGVYQVTNKVSGCGNLVISGIIDGPVTGGLPKAIEFYALADIPDLSVYGFGSANNGGGSDGQEFTFPGDAIAQGTHIWLATESAVFQAFFGFPPTYVNSLAASINGDDAVELFCNGVVIDVFGNINMSGTGQPWEYLDGWAYRVNNTGPDGAFFTLANWTFSGPNALDNILTNATAPIPFPVHTFSSNAGPTCANDEFTVTITIDDTVAPFIICPDNIFITLQSGACEAEVNFDVTATDNCGTPTIANTDNVPYGSGDFFPIGTYTLIYKATDVAGNMATCSFTVNILEFPNPSATLACNDLVQASLDQNGEAIIGADMVLEGGPYGCYDFYDVSITANNGDSLGNVLQCNNIGDLYTVTVTDPVTGAYCWGTIKVEDKLPPIINCTDPAPLRCDQTVTATFPTRPSVTDNCDNTPLLKLVELTLIDDDMCDDNKIRYRRTWIAFDDFGNASDTCSQIITVQRFANINFPDDRLFNCPVSSNSTLPNNTGRPTVINGAFCQYGAVHADEVLEICAGVAGTYKIVRTWTVLDWCSGMVITSGFDDDNNDGIQQANEVDEDNIQVIKVEDLTPPTINAVNVTVSANVSGVHPEPCRSTGQIATPPVSDNCSGVETIKIFTPVGEAINGFIPSPGLPVGLHTITITATDKCGNFSTKNVTLTVVDNIAPVPVCDEITDVDLSSTGIAEVFAETFDDGSHDNCCLDRFEVRRMSENCNDNHNDLVFGPSVVFCCADAGGPPVTVVFRAYDCFNNFNDCMVTVQVSDKIPPVLVSCPQGQRITCDFYAANLETQLAALATPAERNQFLDAIYGVPTFTDNCELTLNRTFSSNLDQCLEGSFTRTWTATDNGNNTSQSCTQTIFVDHVSDWVVEFPADLTVNCGTTPPDFGEPKIFYETCELVAVSHEDELFTTVPDACYKILRTWTIINWCVVGADINQEVEEQPENQLGLIFPQCDLDSDGDCDNRTFRDSWRSGLPANERRPSALDATRSTNPDTDLDSDPWDGYITYQQTIKVTDTVDPVFANGCTIPDVCISDNTCAATFTLPTPDVDDCSSNVTVTAQINIGGAWLTGFGPYNNIQPGTYQVHYNAIDNCNNQVNCNATVRVKDCKKPTPYCKNGIIVNLMNSVPPMVQVWASDLNEGSFDNCPGDLTYSFSANTSNTSTTYDCADVAVHLVDIWVTDAAGNQDFCQTFINVQDNMGACSPSPVVFLGGSITNENDEALEGVEVHLGGNGTGMSMTGPDGTYQFPALPQGGDYSIVPGKDVNPLNGVTTFDLVLISKHILGVQALGSPFKIIAADANRSNSVTTFDLVELRKMILFINDDFPNNTAWRFVKKGFVFPNPVNPFETVFPELANYNNLANDLINANFTGVKIGDVNGSASPNQFSGNDDRNSTGMLMLETKDVQVKKGEIFTVDFASPLFEATGFQFTLNFDKDALEFTGLESGIATGENFGLRLLDKGAITASWNEMPGQAFSATEKVFGLTFTAKAGGTLSDLLSINSRFTKAEAYTADGIIQSVGLRFDNLLNATAFELYQNTPNPFRQSTAIGFNLPEAGDATLTILDVSGKVLKVVNGSFAKGYNEVVLKKNDFPATGVMYYRLEAQEFTKTKKMIMLE